MLVVNGRYVDARRMKQKKLRFYGIENRTIILLLLLLSQQGGIKNKLFVLDKVLTLFLETFGIHLIAV